MNQEKLIKMREFAFRQFPRPFDLEIKKLGRGLSGAEIGVYKGKHAKFMCDFLELKNLSLVDPYQAYGKKSTELLRAACRQAEILLKQECATNKVKFIKASSEQAAASFPDRSLDFVYIDGSHVYKAVKLDIQSWWHKLKKGGIFGGHDFHYGFQGVIKAVTEFSVANQLILNVESPDWWIKV